MQAFFHHQYKGWDTVYFFLQGQNMKRKSREMLALEMKTNFPHFPNFSLINSLSESYRYIYIYRNDGMCINIYIYRYVYMYICIYTHTFKYIFVVHRSFSSVFLAKNLARILCLRLKFRKLLVNKFQPGVQGILMNPCIKICGKVEKASRSPLFYLGV